MDDLERGLVALENNNELEELLEIILKIGNTLNQKDPSKNNKTSFNVRSIFTTLPKIKGCGKYKNKNMLDFILESALNKKPELIQFAIKLANC